LGLWAEPLKKTRGKGSGRPSALSPAASNNKGAAGSRLKGSKFCLFSGFWFLLLAFVFHFSVFGFRFSVSGFRLRAPILSSEQLAHNCSDLKARKHTRRPRDSEKRPRTIGGI
jgi:hypothetical protein